jgi:hypothetical protein
MERKPSMKEEIEIIIVARRIRLLGVIILVGIVLIYVMGLLIPAGEGLGGLNELNLVSLIFAIVLCPSSVFIKDLIIKKNPSDLNTYFNAYIIAFAVCDFGALICITTNLFINENILFATAGLIVSVSSMYFLFPKEKGVSR